MATVTATRSELLARRSRERIAQRGHAVLTRKRNSIRDDHRELADPLYARCARGRHVRGLGIREDHRRPRVHRKDRPGDEDDGDSPENQPES